MSEGSIPKITCYHAGRMKILIRIILILQTSLIASCTSDVDGFFKSENNLSRIIAHQGNWQWEGWRRNSPEALRSALKTGFYGSECDVRMTKDNVLVIEHDDDYHGMKISETKFADITGQLVDDIHLATLDEMLDVMEDNPQSPTKLILDLKFVDIDLLLSIIEKRNLEDRIEFFVTRTYMEPLAERGYAHSTWIYDTSVSPEEAAQAAMKGVSYPEAFVATKEGIANEIKAQGMKAGIWTVDDKDKIKTYIEQGFIVTSDRPIQR